MYLLYISVKIVQNSSKWPLTGDSQAISRHLGNSKRIADGLYAPNMIINTSQIITERYNITMEEPHGCIFVKMVQNSSKWPLAGDFQAISRSLGSSKRIADGLYAPNMILNTSQSITERYNMNMEEPHGRISVKIAIILIFWESRWLKKWQKRIKVVHRMI